MSPIQFWYRSLNFSAFTSFPSNRKVSFVSSFFGFFSVFILFRYGNLFPFDFSGVAGTEVVDLKFVHLIDVDDKGKLVDQVEWFHGDIGSDILQQEHGGGVFQFGEDPVLLPLGAGLGGFFSNQEVETDILLYFLFYFLVSLFFRYFFLHFRLHSDFIFGFVQPIGRKGGGFVADEILYLQFPQRGDQFIEGLGIHCTGEFVG